VNNRHILDQLAQMLVDKETVDAEVARTVSK